MGGLMRGGHEVHSSAASVRKPALGVTAFVLGVLAIVLLLVYGSGPNRASASSHAEAPLIGQDPRADNTDLYAFVSPETRTRSRWSPTTSRWRLRRAGRTSTASTTAS